jgi:putative PEP-CTERM system TPR-repeat lipoprotein
VGGAQRERLLIAAYTKGKMDDSARMEVARIVDQFPKDLGILNAAATFYSQQREFARARDLLAAARALDPKSVVTLSNLARVESDAGDADAVEKALRAIVALEPAHANARMSLARIELRRNDAKAAIAELETARAADAKSSEPRLMLASLYLRAKDTAHADAVMHELVAIGEEDSTTALQTGRLYADTGRYDEALGLFHAVVRRDPKNLAALLETGRVQLARGDRGGARDVIQKALDLDPDGIAANSMMAGVDLQDRRTQDALARVARVRKAHPDSAMAAMLDGEVNLSLRNGEAAARAYATSYKLQPSVGAAIRGFRARSMAGMPDAAAPLLDWLTRQPRDFGARLVLAQELQRQGKNRDAIAQYERVVTDGAPNALALNNLAWLYQSAHDERAQSVAKRAYDMAQGVPAIADTYAWILVDQRRAAEALPILERIVAGPGATAEMRYHLAVARARTGKKDEARADLKRVLAEPGFGQPADARKLLAELGG